MYPVLVNPSCGLGRKTWSEGIIFSRRLGCCVLVARRECSRFHLGKDIGRGCAVGDRWRKRRNWRRSLNWIVERRLCETGTETRLSKSVPRVKVPHHGHACGLRHHHLRTRESGHLSAYESRRLLTEESSRLSGYESGLTLHGGHQVTGRTGGYKTSKVTVGRDQRLQ
jgi:hypothetical protein